VVQVLNKDSALPRNVVLRDNQISVAAGLTAIHVRDASGGITVLENQLGGSGGGFGILFQNLLTTGTTRSGFFVTGNSVQDFITGVAFYKRGDAYSGVEVKSNTIDHQSPATGTTGILFDGTGAYASFAQVASNTFGPGVTTPVRVR
jgi:hypothetical protein